MSVTRQPPTQKRMSPDQTECSSLQSVLHLPCVRIACLDPLCHVVYNLYQVIKTRLIVKLVRESITIWPIDRDPLIKPIRFFLSLLFYSIILLGYLPSPNTAISADDKQLSTPSYRRPTTPALPPSPSPAPYAQLSPPTTHHPTTSVPPSNSLPNTSVPPSDPSLSLLLVSLKSVLWKSSDSLKIVRFLTSNPSLFCISIFKKN